MRLSPQVKDREKRGGLGLEHSMLRGVELVNDEGGNEEIKGKKRW